ncbi:MAG: metallophosphoesterase [Candidatus Woesearchaeota archaeon]
MKIGLISDTHDNVANIQRAVKKFQEENVDLVIHLGDIVAPATLQFFQGLKMKVISGNCDGDVDHIRSKCSDFGFEYLGGFAELELEGKRIYLMHQDPSVEAPEKIGEYDYIFHGHTHVRRDEVADGTHIVNPGAHYYKTEGTIAVVDIGEGTVKFHIV